MKFKIVWSDFAERQIDEIYEYYKIEASSSIAKKLLSSIIDATAILTDSPNVGQIEELLLGRSEKYRYLLHNNYKIIYSVDMSSGFIKMADIFDTRQSPVKIKRNK